MHSKELVELAKRIEVEKIMRELRNERGLKINDPAACEVETGLLNVRGLDFNEARPRLNALRLANPLTAGEKQKKYRDKIKVAAISEKIRLEKIKVEFDGVLEEQLKNRIINAAKKNNWHMVSRIADHVRLNLKLKHPHIIYGD